MLTLVGSNDDPLGPVPNGLWTPNQLHPKIPGLPPYPHECTSPLSVKAKVCLYPHANWMTLSGKLTLTGVYASD
jgi:hypothetical protein